MNKHACKICEGYKHCWHVRQSFREEFYPDALYVTYVGGYAVVTGISGTVGVLPYETVVVCVGVRSIGELYDQQGEIDTRTLYRQLHKSESRDDHHITTVMGLTEKMLNLSQ